MKKVKHINIAFLSVVVGALILSACEKFEYSPYQTEQVKGMPTDLNNANLFKLYANNKIADDTVTIIYSGDSQRFYDELELLVNKVNTLPNIDFFVLAGDITDFGLLQEYLWVYQKLKKLNVPYLCAIGNHDLSVKKGEVYTRMFGEKNFSFIYKGYNFLFHDTNGREYNFNGNVPNLEWLNEQLNDTKPKWYIGISHVPPYNTDFDKNLEFYYNKLFSSTPGFILSLHGHLHQTNDSYYYGDNVRYLVSNSVEKNEAILLKFINGQIIKQMITY